MGATVDAKKIRQKINESFGDDEIYSTSTFRHAEFNELRFNPKFKLERPKTKTSQNSPCPA